MLLFTSRYAAVIAGGIALIASSVALSGTAQARRGDADLAALKQSMAAMNKVKSYRLLMKETDGAGKTKLRTLEARPAERKFHLLDNQMEVVIVPEGSYAHRNGKWRRLPTDMSKAISGFMNEMLDGKDKHATVKLVGASVWKGAPARLYSVAYNDSDIHSAGKIWIRASDDLPIHAESTVTSSGEKETSVGDYDYTTPGTITAPAVK